MAENENTETESQSGNGGNATRTAMKAAAAAAATGAAAVAMKKVLSSGSNGSENGGSSEKKSGNSQSLVKSVASGSWDAAQDALVPLAADAAAAAGKYLATNGPDVVKEQIVPRFIESFNEAS
jgi:deoxycytidylate deaminase